MGRRTIFLLLIATIAAASAQALPTAPAIRLVKIAPATVRGTGFEAAERVQVTISTARARATRIRTANARGAFTVAFPILIALEPCRGTLVISVRGSSGSRATLRRPCRPGDPALP